MKTKIFFTIIILAILGGAFYWFQLRPANIRKECYKVAESSQSAMFQVSKEMGFATFDDETYNKCLAKNGLSK